MAKITINKPLLTKLGYDDYREFIIAFGNWAYTTDFTYNESAYTTSFERLLKEFIESFEGEFDDSNDCQCNNIKCDCRDYVHCDCDEDI